MTKSLSTTTTTDTLQNELEDEHGKQPFDTTVFSGLRIVASFVVVYGHVLFFLPSMLSPPLNVVVMPSVTASEPFLVVVTMIFLGFFNYSVDVFFFMSGYLFGSSFFSSSYTKDIATLKTDEAQCTFRHSLYHMVSRWLRLLPMYGISWAVGAMRGIPACTRFPDVLYEAFGFLNLHPVFRAQRPMLDVTCLLSAWSLSADVQGHIFLCLILLVTHGHPRRTVFFVCTAVIVQMLLRGHFVWSLDHRLTVTESGFDLAGREVAVIRPFMSALGLPVSSELSAPSTAQDILHMRHMTDDGRLYFHARYRTGPLLIGFLTWLLVKHELRPTRWIARHKLLSVSLSFICCFVSAAGALAAALLLGERRHVNVIWEVGNRAFYAVCVGLFVVAMGFTNVKSKKQEEKWVRGVKNLYANEFTHRLAGISYAVYLLHTFALWTATEVPPRVTPESYTVRRFAVSGVQAYVTASVMAVPCTRIETWCSRWLRCKVLGRKSGRGGGGGGEKKTT